MLSRNQNSLFYGVDRTTILLYVIMVLFGWLNIYAAVYNEAHSSIFDLSQKYGKQLLWIGGAAIIAFSVLLIDADFFTAFSYVFYGVLIVANIAVRFIGREVKGSHSWFRFGDFGIQPAEFIKFSMALALAKFLSNQQIAVNTQFRLRWRDLVKNYKNTFIALAIILIPLVLVKKLQDETGLAIVFVAFFIVLYREGLSVGFLMIGMLVAILFVVALVVANTTSVLISLGVLAVLSFLIIPRNKKNLLMVGLVYVFAAGVVLGSNFIYKKLEPHQKDRIDVLLGKKTDLKGVGYNVNQAKIAIGSGGFFGKGYLQGTQTKYDFVPEQETDFIFCTVGEEWGFFGSTIVIFLELFLILRVVFLSERQRSSFSRIYGYGVASILFFHLAVNIGMTIGLMPVIGIPLPFFSYGGSSLWSFTILLFIFIKLDANRLLILR
ncbi:MAG: rod shape-determining protein RodA [Sphingobacteriaceae bacterium]|nr:rod shape-determining protein RodA [Sphingobacteriaceae bacterium]